MFFNILYKWNCQIIFVLSIYSKTYIKRSPLDINTTKLLKKNHTHKLDIAQKGGWHFSNWSVSNTDDSFLIFLTVVWEITLFFSLTWELSLQTYMLQKKIINFWLLLTIGYWKLLFDFYSFQVTSYNVFLVYYRWIRFCFSSLSAIIADYQTYWERKVWTVITYWPGKTPVH